MKIMLTIYTLPSITAIILKLFIAINKDLIKNKPTLIFFSSLFLLNIAELASFLFFTAGTELALWALRIYYIHFIVMIASFILLSASMSNRSSKTINYSVGVITSTLCLLLLTPWIIIDTQSIDYSITRVAGKAYHLTTLFVVSGLLLALSLLSVGAATLKGLASSRCVAMLIAVIPFALVILLTIVLMTFNYKINAASLVSFSITLMLAMLIYTESKHHLFLINSHLPWTQEYQYKRAIRALGDQIHHELYLDDINLKQYQKQLEKIAIAMAHSYSPSTTQADIAKRLDLSPTTLARKMKDEN